MLRQSPNRNQRSKGFKIKHALQIGVLLAVSIWLLYQIKHSHDSSKAFDESTAKLSEKVDSEQEILKKFGRKDLHPRVEETTSENGRHDEDEEIGEEESKPEEGEGESRGGGDDEIDSHDQEKAEEDVDRRGDFVDKEEESEEKASEEQEEKIENVGSSEDQDHDRGDKNIQEAREEHYKGDDASSAVARDAQVINTEVENGASENLNEEERVEMTENNSIGKENKANSIEEVTSHHSDADPKADGGQTVKSNQLEVNNNNSRGENAETTSSSFQKGTDVNSHDQNAAVLMATSNGGESNLQTENSTTSGLGQSESNSTLSSTAENAPAKEESTDSSSNSEAVVPIEQTMKSNMTVGADDRYASSITNENDDAAQGNKSETTTLKNEAEESSLSSTTNENRETDQGESSITNEKDDATQSDQSESSLKEESEDSSLSSTTNENAEAAHGESVDSSDSSLPQEVKDVRTDLGTLPDVETEGTNSEEVAVE